MRIIKEGRQPAKSWQEQCPDCGCVFVFDNSDVTFEQREGDSVQCPTCSRRIDVTRRRDYTIHLGGGCYAKENL